MNQNSCGSKEWPPRLFLGAAGIALAMFGLYEISHGIFRHAFFNERFGRVSSTPALGFIDLGLLFFLIGALLWRRISDWLEPPNSRRRS